MEKKRRCGFIPPAEREQEHLVWARGPVVLTECPQSFVRGDSWTMLEEHHLWRMGGKGDLRTYAAKTAEAFALLESELLREKNNGNR